MVRPVPSEDAAIAEIKTARTRLPPNRTTPSSRKSGYRKQKLVLLLKLIRCWRPLALPLSLLGLLLLLWSQPQQPKSLTSADSTPPLVMAGGDPHVRALMRTISASEANSANPYTILYGGTHTQDLSRHPDQCITIVSGPNQGNCTTAAGRYQFINTTWLEKARQYHPEPAGLWLWTSYSFAPQFQDQVVYAWLSDAEAWGVDIPALLEAGELEQVLRLLSGTWTSLGYGIEDNSITPHLSKVYQQMLSEELT